MGRSKRILALQFHQKAILVVEQGLGRCGIANLAISQLGKLVEEGGGPCGYITFGDLAKQVPKSYITLCKIRPWVVQVEGFGSYGPCAIDGAGFDWSYMADDEVPTNMALMAFSDSEFNKSEFNLANYKRGLASVEEQLVFYKKIKLEKLKQEKESNQLKIENFNNASKSLYKLIGSQMPDKSRKGLGFVSYNVVPPPPTGLFSPSNFDLSNSGLEEFQQPEFKGYGPKTSKNVSEDTSNEVRESPNAPMVEKLVLDDKLKKKTIFPTVAKI
ncbi:hypothetical protein Tco_0997019 [Tanacetum coccineum]